MLASGNVRALKTGKGVIIIRLSQNLDEELVS